MRPSAVYSSPGRIALLGKRQAVATAANNQADTAARAIAQAVNPLCPVNLVLRGYMPPYEVGEFPQGYIELNFSCHKDAAPKSIGIIFGQTDDQDRLYRKPFDLEAWVADPENPLSAPLTVINFDEAWRVIATVVELTGLRRVCVVCGC